MSTKLQVPGGRVLSFPEKVGPPTRTRALLLPEAGYERWAAIYDSTPNPLLALEERCLPSLLPAMHGKVVVDFACGTGRWLQKLLTFGAKIGVGLDISAGMLAIGASKPTITHRLARADCCRLPLKAESFDFGICSFALSHFQNLAVVAHQFAMVLKPCADLVLSDIHPRAYYYGWRTAFSDGGTAVEIQTVRHSIPDILDHFGSCGFTCREIRSERLDDPERPLFAMAGREEFFASACKKPALFIAHFQKTVRAFIPQFGGGVQSR